jgi:outer membrane protein assembly factor BamD (BamD/ComL family)
VRPAFSAPPAQPAANESSLSKDREESRFEKLDVTVGKSDPKKSGSGSAPSARLEIELLEESRKALREGRAADALALLENARREAPSGVLSQEREILMIEALIADGQPAIAQDLARSFEATFPDSAHLARVRSLASAAERSALRK